MTQDQKKIGFPPGMNLSMVLKAYERYKIIFENFQKEREKISLPPPDQSVSSSASTESTVPSAPGIGDLLEMPTDLSSSEVPEVVTEVTCSTQGDTQVQKDSENEDPGVYQAEADCYNGATRENYSWSQTIKELDLKIEVPSSVKSGRQLKVLIERKRIRVSIESDDGKELEYFDRTLSWDTLRDEAVWTFNAKESQVNISLEKAQERWWEAAFEGEDKINTRRIDCSRPMHELDEEAQAKIQQLMYDQHCKRQGLPASDQQKMHDVLAKAWDKDGSPFKGTPFDPSKIDVVPSSS